MPGRRSQVALGLSAVEARRAPGRRPRPRRSAARLPAAPRRSRNPGSASASSRTRGRPRGRRGRWARSRSSGPRRRPASMASSVSRSRPYPDLTSAVVVPWPAIQARCRSSDLLQPAARRSRPCRRERWLRCRRRRRGSARSPAPCARSSNSPARSPPKVAWVWQSIRPGIAARPPASSTGRSPWSRSTASRGPAAAIRPSDDGHRRAGAPRPPRPGRRRAAARGRPRATPAARGCRSERGHGRCRARRGHRRGSYRPTAAPSPRRRATR